MGMYGMYDIGMYVFVRYNGVRYSHKPASLCIQIRQTLSRNAWLHINRAAVAGASGSWLLLLVVVGTPATLG